MRRYLPLIISIGVISMTSLLSIPGSPFLIGWLTQADISAKYQTPITPAGFTFSIWSLIYLSWIVAWCYLAFYRKKHQKIGTWIFVFLWAQILSGIWLLPWWFEWMGTALLVMLLILGALWYSFFHTKNEDWIVRSSIELTMAWIHIATFANTAVWLKYLGIVNSENSIIWWIIILSVAFLATLIFQLKFRAHIVSIVFLWASIGIFWGQPYTIEINFLLFYAIGILMALVFSQLRR